MLGPLFYIIYANDLVKTVSNCKIALYADDTVLYTSHKNFNVATERIQSDVNSLTKWCESNGIRANTEKTKVMVFGSNCTLAQLPTPEIRFNGTLLQTVTAYKYLGLTLDSQLSYIHHIAKVINSVTGKLKQFQRMRSFLSTKAATMVYKGMILPILEYGDIFLTAASVENRKRLQILQNKGLRCALNRGIETSTNDLHLEANLMKLHYRREQHILNYMYDEAQVPANLRAKSKSAMKTRSSNKILLKVKRPITEKFKKSLAYTGPKKWNSLPEKFHHTATKPAYKSLIGGWINDKVCANLNLNPNLSTTTIISYQ